MRDQSDPASASNRLDWLDALRGYAVLGVLLVHAGQVAHSSGLLEKFTSAGKYGVQLFFVVSALTISLTYESHIAQYGGSPRSQLGWLVKRFFRIAPLYYLAALFYPIERYGIYKISNHHYGNLTTVPNILANLLFLHTWIPSANNSVVPGGWSIGVEMFFYTLVPFLWLIKPVQKRIVLLGIGSAACLGVSLLIEKATTGSFYVTDDSYLYYWFPTQAPAIFIGLIFYLSHAPKLRGLREGRNAIGFIFAFLLCLPVAYYCGVGSEFAPVLTPTILAVSFTFLIPALNGTVKRILVNRFAIGLGKISFSVYILHFVVLDCMRAGLQFAHIGLTNPFTLIPVLVVTLGITSGLALLSKRFIEDPSVALGHSLSKSISSGGIQQPQIPAQ